MKIKIKNFELINMINGLNKFVGKDMPLPVRVSYAVNKNIKKLFDEYKIYDKERLKIMDVYEKKTKKKKKEKQMKGLQNC